jgi:hypothetical protein
MRNTVPVQGAPDGLSVVGTIVVGANVVGGAVGANVGVDVVGANVGVDEVGANVGDDVVGASVGVAAHTPSHPGCSAGAVHGNMVVA